MNKSTYIIIFLLAIHTLGCSPGGTSGVTETSSTGGGGTGTGTPGVTTVLTDVKKVVSYGQNLSFNNQTGGANDLALHPTTKLPAIAYVDKSHIGNGSGATPALGALKYAYMDSSGTWNIEVVDVAYGNVACGTAGSFCFGAPNAASTNVAGIVKIGFKSTGQPVIAYVYGASAAGPGTKEIRFAQRSTNGTWTIESAFSSIIGGGAGAVSSANTVDPLKGLTLLIDSLDQIHLTFALYASTISSSQIKYSFRNSGGTWTTSNITTAVQPAAGTATISATGQGTSQAGAAFCSAAAGPIYTYQIVTGTGGHGHPAYIRCSTYSSTLGCTAWTTIDLVNDCGGVSSCLSSFTYGGDGTTTGTNAGNRTDLAVEPTTNKAVIALFSTTAPATGLQTFVTPSSCDVAQSTTAAAWGALTVVDTPAAATTGANGFRIHASSSSNFILSYSYGTGATSALRVNRTTSGIGGWFVNGTIIEAQANLLSNEGLGGAYDLASDLVYIGYAQLPGAAVNTIGNDIRVAYGDPDNISSAGAAGSAYFTLNTIDNTGNSFPTPLASTVPWMSAAKAPSGLIGYTYFYQDSAITTDSKLYYGFRAGTPAAPLFSETQVTNHMESAAVATGLGLSPSLAYDANSNPIIAAHNGTTATGEQNLMVARSVNGGSTFSISVVDESSAITGLFPSVATYNSYIGIAYRDETNTGLRFARWSPTDQWKTFSVDGVAGSGTCAVGNASGQYAKLVFTSTGRPVIAFQDDTASPVTVRLAIASQDASSNVFTWTCLNVDGSAGNTRGEGIDMVLDSTDRPHIVHYDATSGNVRYINSTLSIATAVTTGTSAFVAGDVSSVGVPALVNANFRPSIRVTSDEVVYVTFSNNITNSLVLGTKATALGAASTFSLGTVDSAPTGSSSTTPIVGQISTLLLNSSSKPLIFYRSVENWLRYYSQELL